jgi:hypothetical protein
VKTEAIKVLRTTVPGGMPQRKTQGRDVPRCSVDLSAEDEEGTLRSCGPTTSEYLSYHLRLKGRNS